MDEAFEQAIREQAEAKPEGESASTPPEDSTVASSITSLEDSLVTSGQNKVFGGNYPVDIRKKYHIMDDVLGKGSFGTVRKCRLLNSNQIFALKTINKSRLPDATQLRREVDILLDVSNYTMSLKTRPTFTSFPSYAPEANYTIGSWKSQGPRRDTSTNSPRQESFEISWVLFRIVTMSRILFIGIWWVQNFLYRTKWRRTKTWMIMTLSMKPNLTHHHLNYSDCIIETRKLFAYRQNRQCASEGHWFWVSADSRL